MDYTVGQLAKLSGVTVRALHHYEKLGLLPPSGRSASGYRRYSEQDVLRLHRILVCRQMGVHLKDIAPYLGPGAPPLQALLAQQAAAIQAELDRLQRVLSMLKRISAVAGHEDDHSLTNQLLELMSTMTSLQEHYTAEELDQLHILRDAISPDERAKMKTELADLLRHFAEAESRGTSPSHESINELARRWVALGRMAASSSQIRTKTRALIENEPKVQRATGITPSLKIYIDNAVAAVSEAAC
jgi:MerR family transcriptional regulator, thiopeptide resistance regulator